MRAVSGTEAQFQLRKLLQGEPVSSSGCLCQSLLQYLTFVKTDSSSGEQIPLNWRQRKPE